MPKSSPTAQRDPVIAPRRIAMLVYPGFDLLDAAGPLEVFAAANRISGERGRRMPYRIEVWAEQAGIVGAASGTGLPATRALADAPEPDTLLVAGAPDPPADAACVAWLGQRTGGIRRVGGICTGVFLLAAAGLLDGRRVVTHWAHCRELARRHPAVAVETDPIFVRDGRFYTTAGVTAGMDLALALVEDDLGRDVALAIARLLVLFLKRPGGQSQFSAHLAAQFDGDGPVARLQRWILDHLAADLSIEALAARLNMSPRNFVRLFTTQAGTPPGAFVEHARLDLARRRLEETDDRLDTIAAACGIASAEVLRRLFQRRLGVSPTDYRGRFRSTS